MHASDSRMCGFARRVHCLVVDICRVKQATRETGDTFHDICVVYQGARVPVMTCTAFYTRARLYQLALTDELLGIADGVNLFRGGGRVTASHTTAAPPSTWPFGSDVIPVATAGGVFVPLVLWHSRPGCGATPLYTVAPS